MRSATVNRARHRLGTPGLMHSTHHPEVAVALAAIRAARRWAILTPARHSLAGLRRRAIAHAVALATQQAWTPAATS